MDDPPALRWGRRHGDIVVAWEAVNRPALERLNRAPLGRTPHFTLFAGRRETLIVHRVAPAALDNDIAGLVADELVRPGLVSAADAFERCFAGVVESTGPSPQTAWRRFFTNTLRSLRCEPDLGPPDGPVATFSGIYRHAAGLMLGEHLLDVGSCFAFFPMLLAARGTLHVTASDAHPPTVALARRMAGELGFQLTFEVADLTRGLPFAEGSFDTVTALHVLEHLPAESNAAALAEMCRTAVRRVIVAVPLEPAADPVYGHRQAFDVPALVALAGLVPGWSGTAHEHLGGWIVLEPVARRGHGSSVVASAVGTAPVGG